MLLSLSLSKLLILGNNKHRRMTWWFSLPFQNSRDVAADDILGPKKKFLLLPPPLPLKLLSILSFYVNEVDDDNLWKSTCSFLTSVLTDGISNLLGSFWVLVTFGNEFLLAWEWMMYEYENVRGFFFGITPPQLRISRRGSFKSTKDEGTFLPQRWMPWAWPSWKIWKFISKRALLDRHSRYSIKHMNSAAAKALWCNSMARW